MKACGTEQMTLGFRKKFLSPDDAEMFLFGPTTVNLATSAPTATQQGISVHQ